MKYSLESDLRYDNRYDIGIANINDVDEIMLFLKENWSENHILANDRGFFLYEFGFGEQLNFVLARDRGIKGIISLAGFMYCSNPETTSPNKLDIWGSVWKTINDNGIPFLGVEVQKRILSLTKCRMNVGNALNPRTALPLFKNMLKFKIGKMTQYYLLNRALDEFRIAEVRYFPENSKKNSETTSLTPLPDMESVRRVFSINNNETYPYKDEWYFEKRFFCHPYYSYKVYGLSEEDKPIGALMVTRELSANESKALRIVDYYGDPVLFAELNTELERLLKNNNYEFIEFLEFGFCDEYITNAGFTARTKDDSNIIPSYFEPFVKKNVDNLVNYQYDNTLIFRADADQDRPNLPRNLL